MCVGARLLTHVGGMAADAGDDHTQHVKRPFAASSTLHLGTACLETTRSGTSAQKTVQDSILFQAYRDTPGFAAGHLAVRCNSEDTAAGTPTASSAPAPSIAKCILSNPNPMPVLGPYPNLNPNLAFFRNTEATVRFVSL